MLAPRRIREPEAFPRAPANAYTHTDREDVRDDTFWTAEIDREDHGPGSNAVSAALVRVVAPPINQGSVGALVGLGRRRILVCADHLHRENVPDCADVST